MLKRTRKYAKLFGIELDAETGKPVEVQHVMDGGFTTVESAQNRARKEFPEFLINSVEFHKQVVTMSDDDFYKHGTFGEDAQYIPSEND